VSRRKAAWLARIEAGLAEHHERRLRRLVRAASRMPGDPRAAFGRIARAAQRRAPDGVPVAQPFRGRGRPPGQSAESPLAWEIAAETVRDIAAASGKPARDIAAQAVAQGRVGLDVARHSRRIAAARPGLAVKKRLALARARAEREAVRRLVKLATGG
jgi:hypothetical protein